MDVGGSRGAEARRIITMLIFFCGAFFGGLISFFVMCLIIASRDGDNKF
jgi:phage shock protein PspC (stress-responsive transcriptional regulator)